MLSKGEIDSPFSTVESPLLEVFQDILDEHLSGVA